MVHFVATLFGAAALYAGVSTAVPLPRPDNNVGEQAVSAPNGTPMSDMPSSTASAYQSSMTSMGNSYGGGYSSMNSYGGGYSSMNSYGGGYSSSSSSSYMPSSTMSSSMSYQTPSYGSGMSSWSGGSGYDSCVQQCVASYGSTSMGSYSPPSKSSDSMGSSGTNGATHTVIVAPTQGVLRYVPFAINASVGDTVKFVWGANNHTVTKSSQLEVCNKTSQAPFASGEHDKDFSFTQVVNDTKPTFFYCGTPGHCQKGMFGIINPPSAAGSSNSVQQMMPSMMNSSSMQAMSTMYNRMSGANNSNAMNWGSSMDMSSMPDWAKSAFAENVMYTRTFLAANPDVLNDDGSVNIGKTSNPLTLPADVTAPTAVNAAVAGSSNGNSSSSTGSPSASSSPSPSASSPAKKSGAISVRSSGALAGGVAVLAVLLAL